jgi:hypothetical protein
VLRSFILCSIVLTACAQDHGGLVNMESAADGGAVSDAGSCGTVDSPFATRYPEDGPCDDSAPVRSASWQGHRGAYVVTCDSAPTAAHGCKGIPNDVWGRCSLRRCESTETYPEGCTVYMPTENPYYPGSPQACSCQVVPGTSEPPRWTCGL